MQKLTVNPEMPQFSTTTSEKSLRTYVYDTATAELLGYVVHYAYGGFYTHTRDGGLIGSRPVGSMKAALKRFN